MNTSKKIPNLLLIACSLLLAHSIFAQGDLNPPGPPAPTMKTLTQVEPRTPIESLPFTISQSGSYYFTKSLQFTVASGHAITITVSDVTLDLMGFTLTSVSAVTGDAIRISDGVQNIAVKNGVISGNTTVPANGPMGTIVEAGFDNGIFAGTVQSSTLATNCQFSHLRISGCRNRGLNAGSHAAVEQVTATQNGSWGIYNPIGSVTNSTASRNGAIGIEASSVTNCRASDNQGTGVNADSVANVVAASNSIGIIAKSVTNCRAYDNAGSGIIATEGSVTNSAARSNGEHGIWANNGSVTNSTATLNDGNGVRCDDGVVAFCTAFANGDNDINASGATRTGNHPTP